MKTQTLLKKCFVILMFLGIIGVANLKAQTTFTVGDLNYQINDDGVSVTVIGHVDGNGATGELNIPESVSYNSNDYPVTIIGEYAFYWCGGLTGSLVIPNSVVSISDWAFYWCGGFTGSLTIPNSVTNIGEYAFSQCGFDGTLTLPDSVFEIKTQAFEGCQFIGDLIIPNSVTTIGDLAFAFCYGFTGALIIPDSVTYIGDGAFEYCSGFYGTLTIPSSVNHIGANPFSNMWGIYEIDVESGNEVYDSRDNCNAIIETNTNKLISGCENTVIPNSIVCIGIKAFAGCSWLGNSGNSNIPNTVTIIEDYAFSDCVGLNILEYPSSLTYIGNNAFEGCYDLSVVNLPNTVTYIGEHAFRLCYNITSVNIPSSVESIGINPFAGCYGIECITVDEANAFYNSRDNCNAIIETSTNELISGCKNTVIPNNIVSIGHYAFEYCRELTGDLIIPNTVISIGYYAFDCCSNLDGKLIIGNSVNSIGAGAFGYCVNITDITILATTPPEIPEYWNPFDGINCTTLTVPCGCISAYENSLWSQYFTTFIEDCGDVAEFDGNMASVYPNPTSSIVKIEAENIQNISIYNMLGEMVLDSQASGDTFEYDFSNNESGVYIVRVETAKGVVTKRVTVM